MKITWNVCVCVCWGGTKGTKSLSFHFKAFVLFDGSTKIAGELCHCSGIWIWLLHTEAQKRKCSTWFPVWNPSQNNSLLQIKVSLIPSQTWPQPWLSELILPVTDRSHWSSCILWQRKLFISVRRENHHFHPAFVPSRTKINKSVYWLTHVRSYMQTTLPCQCCTARAHLSFINTN